MFIALATSILKCDAKLSSNITFLSGNLLAQGGNDFVNQSANVCVSIIQRTFQSDTNNANSVKYRRTQKHG